MRSYRFVIDEDCFDLRRLGVPDVIENLSALTQQLRSLRERREITGLLQGWGATPCTNGLDLGTVLNSSDYLERDSRVLLLSLLDRCMAWDEDAGLVVSPEVTVDGSRYESFGIAHALNEVAARFGMAVVTMPHRNHHGVHVVSDSTLTESVCFVASPSDHPTFFRSIYELEDIDESKFFIVGERAFPTLVFAETLRFNRFSGAYRTLRASVVAHLSAINDAFFDARTAEPGDSSRISMRMGIAVSIEASSTRSSAALMTHRQVVHEGTTYRCEWHSKLLANRNRIHFCPRENGTILIGIFADHLPT